MAFFALSEKEDKKGIFSPKTDKLIGKGTSRKGNNEGNADS